MSQAPHVPEGIEAGERLDAGRRSLEAAALGAWIGLSSQLVILINVVAAAIGYALGASLPRLPAAQPQ